MSPGFSTKSEQRIAIPEERAGVECQIIMHRVKSVCHAAAYNFPIQKINRTKGWCVVCFRHQFIVWQMQGQKNKANQDCAEQDLQSFNKPHQPCVVAYQVHNSSPTAIFLSQLGRKSRKAYIWRSALHSQQAASNMIHCKVCRSRLDSTILRESAYSASGITII